MDKSALLYKESGKIEPVRFVIFTFFLIVSVFGTSYLYTTWLISWGQIIETTSEKMHTYPYIVMLAIEFLITMIPFFASYVLYSLFSEYSHSRNIKYNRCLFFATSILLFLSSNFFFGTKIHLQELDKILGLPMHPLPLHIIMKRSIQSIVNLEYFSFFTFFMRAIELTLMLLPVWIIDITPFCEVCRQPYKESSKVYVLSDQGDIPFVTSFTNDEKYLKSQEYYNKEEVIAIAQPEQFIYGCTIKKCNCVKRELLDMHLFKIFSEEKNGQSVPDLKEEKSIFKNAYINHQTIIA